MDKCIAIIKTGPRKGKLCGAIKKVIDVVDGIETPHCNRHKIKQINNNIVNVLSSELSKNLNIEEKEDIKINDYDDQNILKKIDKQLDDLFNEYGL
jgi:hypothetical protein